MAAIVADKNPSPIPDLRHPRVVLGINGEAALVILDPGWQLQDIESSRQGGPDISVEEQDRGSSKCLHSGYQWNAFKQEAVVDLFFT